MGRYIVGNGSDTWNLNDAYDTVVDGDIIEFERDFRFDSSSDSWIIDKNITICGYVEMNGNGGRTLFSSFYGKIVIAKNADVVIENMCLYSNKIDGAVVVRKGGKLKLANSIIGSKVSDNKYVLIWNNGGQLDIDNITLTLEGESKAISVENNGILNIRNSNNLFKIVSNDSETSIVNSRIICHTTNGVNSKKSKLEIIDSYIEGSPADVETRYPVIWGGNSRVVIKNSKIIQPRYTAAINICDNSILELENNLVSNMGIYNSRAKLRDNTISDIISVENFGLCISEGQLDVKGEHPGKIDIYVANTSVFSAEKVTLNRVCKPNVNVVGNSLVRIKSLNTGNVAKKELNFKIDDSSEVIDLDNLTKEKRVAPKEVQPTEKAKESVPTIQQLDNLIGLRKVKEEISKMLHIVDFNNKRIAQGHTPEKQALHAVFVGNPGTGKTTVARLMGKILFEKGVLPGRDGKCVFVEAKESDLISSNVGGTALQTRRLLDKALGGVLFIDEAYTLDKKGSVNFGIEAINTILAFMEDHRDEIMIIFAGYTKEMDQFLKSNPGLKSRVPNTFDFEDYSSDEIVQIGNKYLESKSYVLEDQAYYNNYVKNAYKASLDKSNARWIRNTNESILKALASRVIENDDDDVTTIKNIDIEAVKNIGRYEDDGTKKDAMEELNKLIGIKKVKEQVENFVALAEINKKREEQGMAGSSFSLHSMFLGNPGTGKTTVARLVGEVLYQKGVIAKNKLIEVTRTDLVGTHIGHTAVKTREVLESALGGVLFIDEAYTLNSGSSNDFGQEALDEILKFMEDHRDDIVIIFAGYTKEMGEFLNMNSGLRSRIPNTFDFEDYTEEEIVGIGLLGLDRYNYKLDREYYSQVIKNLYKNNDGSNGRWVRNINEKIITNMSTRVAREDGEVLDEITNEDISKLVEQDARYTSEKDDMAELNKLIGIKKVKEQVEQFVALAEVNKRRAEQGKTNSSFSLHSMFLGNPGTGKTTVARLVGKVLYQKGVISEEKLVEVSRTDLVAGYVGQTTEKTRKVLESALGGVLFIDEAYTLNSGGSNDFGQEALDEILKFMEDHRDDIVIIFAGYTKEMGEFLNMNSGLRSRIPNTFDFEDYREEEIVEIGLLGLDKYGYELDREYYGEVVKELYRNNDESNGRWIRNINEKIITNMSTRIAREGGDNLDEITNEDIEKVKERIDG